MWSWSKLQVIYTYIRKARKLAFLIEDDLAKTRNSTANWEGEAGGRGIRALARYIYQPPAPENLTHLITIYNKMTGFFMVIALQHSLKNGTSIRLRNRHGMI